MKVVIIGGVAGGASVAARLRRLDETAEIVLLERSPYVSYANCGLPYYIGGVIRDRNRLLLQTPASLRAVFNLDVRVNSEAIQIDRAAKSITVRNVKTGEQYQERYDKLVLSPGAAPLVPPVAGHDLPGVFSLRTVPDTDAIKAFVDDRHPSRAVVIGGGFIGIELAENLHKRGVQVTIVEMMDQVLLPLDYEMAAVIHQHLRSKEVGLALGDGLQAIEQRDGGGLRIILQSGRSVDAEMAILAIGVRPESTLAQVAGLTLGVRGTIATNEHLQTSDPDIYAIGDAAQVTHLVSGQPAHVPLAGPANRQGRLVADHIAGRAVRYRGVQGTSIVQVFGLAAATTGLNRRQLEQAGISYQSAIIHASHHAGYYPGASSMTIKLLFGPEGRILGAQIVGAAGVDKRIDVIATALRAGLMVYDLEDLELAYAPPYGSARDPVNLVGFVASNILRGDAKVITWDQVAALDRSQVFFLDVRDPDELAAGYIEGSVNIPLRQVRARMEEIPKDRRIIVYCAAGQRAYYACRILAQHGYDVVDLAGGYRSYSQAVGRQSSL